MPNCAVSVVKVPMLAHDSRGLFTPRTSLVGREQEVGEICDLVLHGRERLVTLTGVGGCGKTRLALEVARRMRDAFADGVWLVELAGVSDPRRIGHRIAGVLAIRDGSNAALAAALQHRTLLLVLDNCEHIVDACASVADSLLSSCGNLRILATSREPLLIPGERQRRLPPLAIPSTGVLVSPEMLAGCPAAQLFVERAEVAARGFQLTRGNAAAVARICTLLDGIPLAIELAAAQTRVLAADQIAARLDDCFRLLGGGNRLAPTRQQTLRASLDWSHALLSPTEQVVFRRLAVLGGSWSVEAAEAVCAGDERTESGVLAVLTRLLDKSLVLAEERNGEVRFRLLEPVRQYAARRLEASGEVEAVQARHAMFCVALAERAGPELQGPRQLEWLRRIDAEGDNLRAALGRAEQAQDATTILRIAGALYYFLWLRRHLREGQHWFEVGLASAEHDMQHAVRAKGLFGLTLMLSLLGENSQAEAIGQHAIASYRDLNESGPLALLGVILAQTTLARGDVPGARRLAEDAVVHARASGASWPLGHAQILLGQVLHRQGESSLAVRLQGEAQRLFELEGDSWSRAYALASLASLREPRPSVARVAALAGLRWSWELADYPALASALEYLALHGGPERPDTQVWLCAAASALRQSLGIAAPPGERDDVESQLAWARGQLGETAYRVAWNMGHAIPLERVVAAALSNSPAAGPHARGGRGEALTPREREVAHLLVQGATDKQIAQTLTITEGTAGLHVHHVLAKLRLRSRVQVADRAAAVGLIEPAEVEHASVQQPSRKI